MAAAAAAVMVLGQVAEILPASVCCAQCVFRTPQAHQINNMFENAIQIPPPHAHIILPNSHYQIVVITHQGSPLCTLCVVDLHCMR